MVIKQLLWRKEHHLRKLPSTTQSELLPYSALHHAGEWVGLFTWNFKWHAGETTELSFLWGKNAANEFFHCLAVLWYSFWFFMHKKTLHGGWGVTVCGYFFVCFTPFVGDKWIFNRCIGAWIYSIVLYICCDLLYYNSYINKVVLYSITWMYSGSMKQQMCTYFDLIIKMSGLLLGGTQSYMAPR